MSTGSSVILATNLQTLKLICQIYLSPTRNSDLQSNKNSLYRNLSLTLKAHTILNLSMSVLYFVRRR
jgi:hypothetical protein